MTYQCTNLGLTSVFLTRHLRVTWLPACAWMSPPASPTPSMLTFGTAGKIQRKVSKANINVHVLWQQNHFESSFIRAIFLALFPYPYLYSPFRIVTAKKFTCEE